MTTDKKRKNDIEEEDEQSKKRMIMNNTIDVKPIDVGDTVNLSELLFTENRNYLIKYNQNKRVKAEDLAGKVTVLLFLPLSYSYHIGLKEVVHLSDIYSRLHPAGSFEVVFVATRDEFIDHDQVPAGSTPRERFLERFSDMAWPAIPFEDLKSRKHLHRIFGGRRLPFSFIIDPRGVVIHSYGLMLFATYGAAGYPFTNERIQFLDSQDKVAKIKPSMINLFGDDYHLITNKGVEVPVSNLEDKLVALYLSTDPFDECFAMKLKMAYEELNNNLKQDFEVVFIYMPGWWNKNTLTDEDSFWKLFKDMPWLGLPLGDTNCNKKLQRIFKYPLAQEVLRTVQDPKLVIIGPHGKFIEPLGANILSNYGAQAYPFTIPDAVALELKKVKGVKLDMFWDLDAVFRKENGSEVRFSQILGKKIIVLFQNWWSTGHCKWKDLKAKYIKMKGTNDEFEVIHIYDGNWSKEIALAMPWLMHPLFGKDTYAHGFIGRVFRGRYQGLLAFDRDGVLVRRTNNPSLGDDTVFPFYDEMMDMESEVFRELESDLNMESEIDH